MVAISSEKPLPWLLNEKKRKDHSSDGCNLKREAAPLATLRVLSLYPSSCVPLQSQARSRSPGYQAYYRIACRAYNSCNLKREADPLATIAELRSKDQQIRLQSQARSRSPGYVADEFIILSNQGLQSQARSRSPGYDTLCRLMPRKCKRCNLKREAAPRATSDTALVKDTDQSCNLKREAAPRAT